MTEPEQYLRRLRAITANAILPALERKHLLPGVQPWWLPLSARLQVANGIVQALLDAGAIPPPPPEPGTPRHTASDITDDQLAALYSELDEARQQIATGQASASAREALLEAARDALQDAGLRGHGDCWPDITAPIHALIAERDRWRRGYDHHYQRAERAEEADQRVRDLHRPFVDRRKGLITLHAGPTQPACAECHGEPLPCPTIRALDNQEPK